MGYWISKSNAQSNLTKFCGYQPAVDKTNSWNRHISNRVALGRMVLAGSGFNWSAITVRITSRAKSIFFKTFLTFLNIEILFETLPYVRTCWIHHISEFTITIEIISRFGRIYQMYNPKLYFWLKHGKFLLNFDKRSLT